MVEKIISRAKSYEKLIEFNCTSVEWKGEGWQDVTSFEDFEWMRENYGL